MPIWSNIITNRVSSYLSKKKRNKYTLNEYIKKDKDTSFESVFQKQLKEGS